MSLCLKWWLLAKLCARQKFYFNQYLGVDQVQYILDKVDTNVIIVVVGMRKKRLLQKAECDLRLDPPSNELSVRSGREFRLCMMTCSCQYNTLTSQAWFEMNEEVEQRRSEGTQPSGLCPVFDAMLKVF
jgi:hypothetical protein